MTLHDLFFDVCNLNAPNAKVILGESPEAGPLIYLHGDSNGTIHLYTYYPGNDERNKDCTEMDVEDLAHHIVNLVMMWGPGLGDDIFFGESRDCPLASVKAINEDGKIIEDGDDITHVILEMGTKDGASTGNLDER